MLAMPTPCRRRHPHIQNLRCVDVAGHTGVHMAEDSAGFICILWTDDMDDSDLTGLAAREAVNHPAHYGGAENPYEAIKVIEAWELNFNLGNVLKYVSRAGRKDASRDIEDLEKAAAYLRFEIERRARNV
jgi:hypothetical protein